MGRMRVFLLLASVMTLNASLATSASVGAFVMVEGDTSWLKHQDTDRSFTGCQVNGKSSAQCPPMRMEWLDYYGLPGAEQVTGLKARASAGYGWVEAETEFETDPFSRPEIFDDPKGGGSVKVTYRSEAGAYAAFSDVIYLHPSRLKHEALFLEYYSEEEFILSNAAEGGHGCGEVYGFETCIIVSPLIMASTANAIGASASVTGYDATAQTWGYEKYRRAYTRINIYNEGLVQLKHVKYWTTSGRHYPIADAIYATPEPLSCGLVAAGLGVIAWKRRRYTGS